MEQKNYLRGLLTLGMVKFRTVYVATPLFLAEDGLHVIELDKDNEVKNHYLFDNDRLANAKIFPKDDPTARKQLKRKMHHSLRFLSLANRELENWSYALSSIQLKKYIRSILSIRSLWQQLQAVIS